jgi:CheY-specific phosphatase CheX
MEEMQKIHQSLKKSIFEVFEKMFFVFLEPAEAFPAGTEVLKASIRFRGPRSGILDLLFTADLATKMVQNLLLKDLDEISERDVEDCLKESANVVCGNFLRIFDSSLTFDLSIPGFERNPGKPGEEKDEEAGNPVVLHFQCEGGGLSAILRETGP